MKLPALAALALIATPAAAQRQPAAAQMPTAGALLPVKVDRATGQVLVTLPAPDADGVSGRFLYAASLRTGLGSAPAVLDRGRLGDTRVLAFRRFGKRVAIQFENPRFRGTGGTRDFAVSTVFMADVVTALPDGRATIDLAPFLAGDVLGIAASLGERDAFGTGERIGAGKDFKLDEKLSATDTASVKVFPLNIEADALQTYVSDTPGAEVENILPDPKRVSFTVHHSLVALPPSGYAPKPWDPRIGGFSAQVVDFAAPLGQDVVKDFAARFRLEKTDPAAARSTVRKPIVFYIDPAAPEPIRSAVLEGANWWRQAFEAAGYIDAYRAELLPAGIDPLDARYNVVTWVDRATRGWSYGQTILDPRTGEIVKGMVVLGSLRARQDIEIFKGLVGAGETGSGSANDPVRVALARLRQLAAHEVGHSLGFGHNFAASTQERASVLDYPPPRVRLVDGRPDLADAYGTGVGKWDVESVAWLYADKAAADPTAGMRYVADEDARPVDSAQPWGGLWDDGADPVAELANTLAVRRAALDRFGTATLAPGEPAANLRRRFVPVWLFHRYQLASAAKSIGGVEYWKSVAGDANAAGVAVAAARQRAALTAVLAALTPEALTVPARLVPLLSAGRNGAYNRQYDIELLDTAGGPVFDPLVATDVGAEVALAALLAPKRLQRLVAQHAVDPAMLGVEELLDRLVGTTVAPSGDAVSHRLTYRTMVTMAQVARDGTASPEVAAALDARVQTLAARLAKGDPWSRSLARQLADPQERERLLADRPRRETIPPGEPIGEDDWLSGGL